MKTVASTFLLCYSEIRGNGVLSPGNHTPNGLLSKYTL